MRWFFNLLLNVLLYISAIYIGCNIGLCGVLDGWVENVLGWIK